MRIVQLGHLSERWPGTNIIEYCKTHSSPDYIDIFNLVADGKLEEVKKYLDKSENRNVMDEIGRSLLIVAIDCNKEEMIELLLNENKKVSQASS